VLLAASGCRYLVGKTQKSANNNILYGCVLNPSAHRPTLLCLVLDLIVSLLVPPNLIQQKEKKEKRKKKDSATVRLLVFEQKEEYQQVQNGIKHWLTHFTLWPYPLLSLFWLRERKWNYNLWHDWHVSVWTKYAHAFPNQPVVFTLQTWSWQEESKLFLDVEFLLSILLNNRVVSVKNIHTSSFQRGC